MSEGVIVELDNIIGIDTTRGFRTIELYKGDLSSPDLEYDILVVSAFSGNYFPTHKSLVGSIYHNCKINLHQLHDNCEFNLLEPFSIWISKEIDGLHFKRIICLEMVGSKFNLEKLIKNIFIGVSILEFNDINVNSVAIPLIGTGSQQLNTDSVVSNLVCQSKEALEKCHFLSKIIFADKDKKKVEIFSEAINKFLNRYKVALPKNDIIKSLQHDILISINSSLVFVPPSHAQLFIDIRLIIGQDSIKSFEIGILGRRLVEFIVDNMLNYPGDSLYRRIEKLREINIAPWIMGYLHTLRLLGNNSAHESPNNGRYPPFIQADDLAISLFCFYRVLNFWHSWKGNC